MDAPPPEFEAVCEAVASADDPFRRFVLALEPDGRVPRPYRRVLDHSAAIAFAIAPPGAWTRSHSQFAVDFGLGPQARVTVTLPDHFASPAAAAQLVARTGYRNVFHVRRLRHIVAIVLDLMLFRRLDVIRQVRDRFGFLPDRIDFIVSWEDFCNDTGVLTLSRCLGFDNVMLPDTNYFDSHAYETHKLSVVTSDEVWSERSDRVVWRGVTTGSAFTADTLMRNERIALAAHCSRHPDLFDVRITGVVQTRPGEHDAVAAELGRLDLIGAWKPFDDFRRHRFVLHIDGNSSAMGFFEKLSLRCCVLKVESRFEQWFEPRLAAWTHFVPVRADYSDLVDKVLFLRANPDLAERIAQAGFAFAMEADFATESALFVRELVRSLPVQRHRCVLAAPDDADATPDGWHGLERDPDGTRYRWTAGADVSWPLDLPDGFSGLLTVEIAFRSEIRAGFAAESLLIVGDARRPVRIVGAHLRAEIPVGSRRPAHVVLRMPPPVVPALEWDSADDRALGLAIRTP